MTKKTTQEISEGFFYDLSEWKQHAIALAILFLVPFFLFTATTIGGKELQRHDITQWRAGAESIIEYREQFGEEPLWASNMFGGMPSFVVSTKTQVPHLDYFYRFFSKIYPAFQYWILLFGMYYLLILMKFRPLSAALGGLLFGLTAYLPIIIVAGHTSKFLTIALSPWIIAGYWLLTRSDKKIPGLLLFIIAMALNVRASHPQITYYFMYLLGALWIYDSWFILKKKDFKKWSIITLLLVVGGISGILSNAERTLSQQQYAPHSIRGGSDLENTTGLDEGYAFAWSQGISETLTLLIPDLYGGASPDYWGPKSITSGPHYLGIITFLFLVIALFKVRKHLMLVFFGVGTLSIFFAWGGNFLVLNQLAFDFIPFFNKFRAPETWLILTSFCYTVVAVYGLEWTLDFAKEKTASIKQLYTPLAAIIGIAIITFVFVKSQDFVKPGEVERIAVQIAQQNQVSPQNPQVIQRANQIVNTRFVPDRQEKANKDALRLFLVLVVAGTVIYFTLNSKISIGIASIALITLAGFEMVSVDKRYMPEQNFVSQNVDPESYIKSQERDIDRYIQENISDKKDIYPYRVLPLLDGAFSNAVPSYYYPSLGGYSGAKLSVAQDVLMRNDNPLFAGDGGINLDLLAVLNTKFLTFNSGLNLPGITPVFQGQQGSVYQIDNVLPKAFFVDSVITADNPQEAYDLLYPNRVNFSKTAIVENHEPAANPDSLSSIEITNYTGAEISLKLSRSIPGFLVLSEIYYPQGWEARLNGKLIPIYKTNYLLRGMEIPAGEHTLELDFRPSSFYTGARISFASLMFQVGLLLVWGFMYWKEKKSSGEE